jgi:hypothetical protein
MGLPRAERRRVHRDLKRGLNSYWGKWGLTHTNVSVPEHVRMFARKLAVQAHLAGRPLPEPELIELAVRLLYWSTATAPYRESNVGTPVRDAAAAAFARLLPEPLRQALETDRRHLHEIRESLHEQDHRRYHRDLDGAGSGAIAVTFPDALDTIGQGGGAVAEHPLSDLERDRMIWALRGSREAMTPLEELTPAMPRAPPGAEVLVRDDEFPVPGVIAFGWAERGAVVITRATAEQIAARYVLDPDAVQDWWDRLLSHEVEFHLGEHPEHTGPRHDADAAPIAAEWFGWLVPRALRPMTGGGGARSPPPSAATVWIWQEKGMPPVEFRRKAEELLRLGDAGQLYKARNPDARNPSVTKRYTRDLVNRITMVIGPSNAGHAERLIRRVKELMDPDHVHELQLGGKDVAPNIRMLDRLTNRGIGSRQLRPQLMSLPDGTPVRIDVLDIADLASRISTVVGDGTLSYRRLMSIFGVPKAVVRGAFDRTTPCERSAGSTRSAASATATSVRAGCG